MVTIIEIENGITVKTHEGRKLFFPYVEKTKESGDLITSIVIKESQGLIQIQRETPFKPGSHVCKVVYMTGIQNAEIIRKNVEL